MTWLLDIYKTGLFLSVAFHCKIMHLLQDLGQHQQALHGLQVQVLTCRVDEVQTGIIMVQPV